MMLIYDIEEQNNQQKNSTATNNNNKGSGQKFESDYSIKSKNSEETTNRKQRPMSGMSYQKKQNETNQGFSNSKQSDFNFFNTPQQFNSVNNQNPPFIQGQQSMNNNNNSNNNNNFNSALFGQTAQSVNIPVNQNMGYQNGNQYYGNQRPQNTNQQILQHQQQSQGMSQQNDGNLYQNFARMMKNMDEETIKSLISQYQTEQQFGKQKNNFM